MRRFVSFGPAFVVLVTTCAILFLVPPAVFRIRAASTRATITLARQSLADDDILERLNNAVRNIARSVEPSVVHIEVHRYGAASAPVGARGGSFSSTGSGWVYDELGHVVTNAHLAMGGTAFRVQFHDGRVESARLVGGDPISDIAVLKVESKEVHPIRRGVGATIEQGERVFAFGSPFGFKFSMSEGIVSGLGRTARGAVGNSGISNFIQTDAAINPGNSGGPLVDIHGRLVGMNVAIATAAATDGTNEGQSSGISFAIPLSTIESRVPQIIRDGKATPAFLGVRFLPGARFVDVPAGEGTRAFRGRGFPVEVTEGSPAAKGGLLTDDLILSINGVEAQDEQVWRAMINTASPGDAMKLRVLRGEATLELSVRLGTMSASLRADQVRDILRNIGLFISESDAGPVVDYVSPQSAYAEAVESGWIVLKVGETPVSTLREMQSALADFDFLSGRDVVLTLGRGEERQAITVRAGR
jgi:S1-C subfamily serine protease